MQSMVARFMTLSVMVHFREAMAIPLPILEARVQPTLMMRLDQSIKKQVNLALLKQVKILRLKKVPIVMAVKNTPLRPQMM